MKFKENILLSEHTSYRIGGAARYFCEPKNIKELSAALRDAKENKLKVFVLGGGTNVLLKDDVFDGLVLKPAFKSIKLSGSAVTVGAGVLISDLLNFVIKNGLSGLEWAGGLPGTVGGAIRGNAGAFGGEIKDVIASVQGFSAQTFEESKRSNKECKFAYRSSVFKENDGGEIVLSAVFKLAKGDPKKIKLKTQEKIDYRRDHHPIEYPNIGSTFKNVSWDLIPKKHRAKLKAVVKKDPFPVVPTAYLISETGLKGVSFGGAMISPKHPNFIVNVLNANASDVQALISLIKKEVKKKFQIDLEEEVMRL